MPELSSDATRRRVFLVLVLACAGVAVAAVAWSVGGGSGSAVVSDVRPAGKRLPVSEGLIFRSLDQARPSEYGRIARGPLEAASARRTSAGLACARVHFAAGRGLCLTSDNPLAPLRVRLLGRDLRVRGELELQGVPSRARVSPDGRYGAVTAFVSGHSYADPGGFSTETTLIDMSRRSPIADLESFSVTRDGRTFRSIDFNFWGVTFTPDSDVFYASLGTGGRTYLVRGNVTARTAEVLRENAECPSVSPDGTRLVYKKVVGESGAWRYHMLNLTSDRETALAEARPIDDQAEWLDNRHVLYRYGVDTWVVPADGTGRPRLFLRRADSPAVVR